ncbi:MAG: hypothetical protein FWE58_05670, partial [Methanobrevibacter sp.]|nr:hypothetical protein [Methanobrevibacter sp.]
AKSGDIINLGNNIYTSSSSETNITLKNITNSTKNVIVQGQSNGSPINVTANKNITIQGQSNTNRATLNANNLHSILYVDSGSTVTLKYINFEKGGFFEGAIIVYGNIIIENCTFSNSLANQGSAITIFSTSSSIIISYCDFNNNHANSEGGAIFHSGNGILNISNSNFNRNTAKNGGAIYTTKPSIISSSIFTNNVASNNGGAIYTTSSLNVTGGSISGNNAIYGSGIYNTGTLRLNAVTLTNNNAQILSISIEASNSVKEGDSIVVSSSLTSGDNVVNGIYTKNTNVYINNITATISDKPVDKTITLNVDGKTYTVKTDSNGVARFTASILISSNLKIVKLTTSYTENGKTFNKVKNIEIIAKNNISTQPSGIGNSKNKVNNIDKKKKPTTNNAVTKVTKSSTKSLSNAKAKAYIKSKKSSTSKKSSVITQAYDYRNKKMVWFNVKTGSNINQYPAGLRLINTTTTTKVSYAITSKTKNTSNFNSKTNTNTTVKYTILYNIKGSKSKVVKITTTTVGQSTKNLANEYLETTINAEVNNPRIVALAKQITSGVKSDDYYTKAKLIYKWVQENIDYTLDANISAVQILSQKGSNGNYKAFCVGFSNVMAALCRSVGVPVEYHAILFFEEEYYPFQGHEGHVYTKVYVNGQWLFADAATVGFIAPLNYTSYLQTMPTQSGGSYDTYTNSWNYWYFLCNNHLIGHSDSHITREAQGVPVLEYFNLSTSASSVSSAYNILSPYANNNGYIISKSYYFSGYSNYIDPNNYIPVWGFHYFDGTTGNFLGYMILSQSGILFTAITTSYWVPPGTPNVEV